MSDDSATTEGSASAKERRERDDKAIKDDKGSDIVVGAVVRVVAKGLKAFQINPKFYGSFDEKSRKFVPVADKKKLGAKYLEVPVGMRGTVTKVYETDDISANYPVQVKFEPGKKSDEEGSYDPPVAFLMHFTPHEIECCSP